MILMILACVQAGAKPGVAPPGVTDSEPQNSGTGIVSIAIDGWWMIGALSADGQVSYWDSAEQAPWTRGWLSVSGGPDGRVCAQADRGYACVRSIPATTALNRPPYPLSGADWQRTTCLSSQNCCSLNTLGGLYCWGHEEKDGWVARSGVTDYSVAFNVGGDDVHYIQDGTVHRWGSFGALDPAIAGEATAVGGSGDHACVLRPDGQIDCNDPADAWPANDPPPEGTFVSISIGEHSNCAVSSAGDIQCWGMQDGDLFDTWMYATYDQPGAYTQVVVSDYLGCAITVDGCVICWASWFDGTGNSASYPTPDNPLCHAGQVLTE